MKKCATCIQATINDDHEPIACWNNETEFIEEHLPEEDILKYLEQETHGCPSYEFHDWTIKKHDK